MNSFRQGRFRTLALFLSIAFLWAFEVPTAQARPRGSINPVPTIQNISFQNGQLVASGTVAATVNNRTTTQSFTNVPVNLSLAPDQSAAGACPVLDLALAPINLDLLGLVVETSPICLNITAYEGGGLLGDLLCSVANLLNGGLSLDQILSGLGLADPVSGAAILPGLATDQIGSLLTGVTDLLNAALGNLFQSVVTAIDSGAAQHTCGILHLELGPLDLNLLGLGVTLDDCNDGPVIVDITAENGQGNLLGNLLCGLLNGGGINLGTTLQTLLSGILGG